MDMFIDGTVHLKIGFEELGQGITGIATKFAAEALGIPEKNVDVMLSGHSHAGQVRLPVLTRLILPPGGKFYPYGLYRPQGPGAAQLYVSRGIGMSGVPFRFLAPPELVVLG